MKDIKIDFTRAKGIIDDFDISGMEKEILAAHKKLHERSGEGNEFLGWVDLPVTYNKDEFNRIKCTAERIKSSCDVFIIIGIGGSYLGSRAAIEVLKHSFYNNISKDKRKNPEIYFLGNNMSPIYLKDIMDVIEEKDICINVISKSGTTTEPAIAFRIFKDYIEKKYGKDEAKNRIFATTDKERGALKSLADTEGYECFVIPDDVGGRFSVLTPVGLLPMAVSGIDINEVMKGAEDGFKEYSSLDIYKNAAYQYAMIRNLLYRKGKCIEIMANFEPSMHYFAEWWKQLYGESEGKNNLGIFPASADFTTDLHSMGQYIQDGVRNLFETFIDMEKPRYDYEIVMDKENIDGLNFLAGNTMNYVNKRAMEGTTIAHEDGGVPNITIRIPKMNEYNCGKLIYMFEKACGISGYVLGVNPFNQPGVEEYKKNMFALLGKPGYEKRREQLQKRIK